MKHSLILVFTLALAACAPPTAPTATPPPAPVKVVTATPATPPEAAAGLSFQPAVYQDDQGRYQISYPASWTVEAAVAGSRGSYVQFTSWQHEPGGFNEVPEGGTVMQVTIYQWDPKGDLAARLEMRRTSFIDSGNTILEESRFDVPGGPSGVRLLLQNADGSLSPVVLLTLGNYYLELSGEGDQTLLDEIMGTFRYLN